MKTLLIASALALGIHAASAQVTARRLTERIRPQTEPQAPPARPAPSLAPRPASSPTPAAPADPARAEAKKAEQQRKVIEFQKKKAEEGYPIAQYDLGMRYWKGDGLDKDPVLARKWLHAASTNGSAVAEKKLKELEAEIAKVSKALPAPAAAPSPSPSASK